MRTFEETLKENGYKLTGQRRIVLKVLHNRMGEHFTAEEVHSMVRNKHKDIGLATVYRTLQLLSDLRLLDKLNLDDGVVRYEMSKMDEQHRHHHLICEVCGSISGVEGDMLEDLEELFYKRYGFKVVDHILKCYGVCKECNEKEEKYK